MTQDQPTTRRERRIAARKAQILEAATRVFAEKGFYLATMKEIADAADVSEGTIYNYFDSKDDLLFAIIAQMADLRLRQGQMDEGLHVDFREFMIAFFLQRFAAIEDRFTMLLAVMPEILYRRELRERYVEQLVEPGMAMLEQHLQARAEQGEMRALDVPLVSRALMAMTLGFIFALILGDPVTQAAWDDPAALTEALATMIFEGLKPE